MQTQASADPVQTRIYRDSNGWRAKTCVEIDATRVLIIKTNRVFNTGPLLTTASVWHVSQTGNGLSHAFGLGVPGYGDFHQDLIRVNVPRLTEKVIEAQHTRALANLESIKAQALAFYAKPVASVLEASHVPG
jgi:hypothetical protein